MSDKKLTEIELDALLIGESFKEPAKEKYSEDSFVAAWREPKPKRKVEMLSVSKPEPVKPEECCNDCDECNLCDCTEVCKKIEPVKKSWLRSCPSKNVIIAVLAAALWFSYSGLSFDVVTPPGPNPPSPPTPSIVVDAPSVLFATDGKTGLTIGQATVIQSQKVQEFCDKNGIDYRRFDIEDDLSTELEHWRKMMEEASEAGVPCMVLITADGKGRIEEIPSTTDEAIKKLGEIK